jgi:hypothetical protein
VSGFGIPHRGIGGNGDTREFLNMEEVVLTNYTKQIQDTISFKNFNEFFQKVEWSGIWI